MKRLFLIVFATLLLGLGHAYAADIITGAVYDDISGNGQVDTITVTFDETITCTSGPGANGWSVNNPGSINVGTVTNVTCSGSTDVVLTVSANADETGGAVDPTLDYSDAGGDLAGAGQITDKTNQTVTDGADPVLISFTSSTGDDEYGPTSTVNITATASEDVTAASSLTVDVNTGATGIALSCAGSSPLCTGTYTVGATGSGENTTDLSVSNISAASLVDGSSNTNTGTTLPTTNIDDASDIEIDTTVPTLVYVDLESDGGNLAFAKTGDTVTLNFIADEEIATPTVTIDGNAADSVVFIGGNDWQATRVMQAGDTEGTVAFTIDFDDTAATSANSGTQVTAVAGGGTNVTYDETVPVLVIGDDILAGPVQSDDYTVTETETNPDSLEYGFSADATCDAGDTYGNALTSGVANTFNTEGNNGNYVCTRSVDSAGNTTYSSASANTLNIDVTSPTGTITEASGQSDPTNSSPVVFQVVFDEAIDVVTFVNTDVDTTGTTATIGTVAVAEIAPNDGTTFEITIPVTADGDVIATVTTGSVADPAGNTNNSTVNTDNSVTVDTVAPTITMVSSVTANGSYNDTNTVNVQVTFDEAVTLAGGNFELTMDTGATPYATTINASTIANVNYGVGAGENSADLNVSSIALTAGTLQDAAGNNAVLTLPGGNNLADNKDIIIDTTDPVLQSFTSTTVDGTYGPTTAVNVTATYDENVTGTIDVTLNNTGTATLTCSGTTTCTGNYTVGATGSGEDIATLDVSSITSEAATDDAGNTQATSTLPATTIVTASTIVVDTTAPTLSPVSIASDNTDPTLATTGDTITVSFTSDEDLAATPTVTIAGQSATVTGGPTVWSATYTIAGTETEGVAAITIDGADLVGNALVQVTATTDASAVTIDYSEPDIISFTSTTVDGTYGPTTAINVTATYDENITGSLTVDLNNTVTGIVLTCAGGSAECSGTYTVGATGSGEDIATLDVSAISVESVTDATGNNQSASALPATTIVTASTIVVDVTSPVLQSFTSTTVDGTYGPTTAINVTATYDENITGSLTVDLNNTVTGITLTCAGGSTDCTGTYTVGATGSGEDIATLDVSSITAESVTDDYANNQAASAMPATTIATASTITVDVTAPTLPTVSIASSNADTTRAYQLNTVTLSFTADEAIVSLPTVVINGSDASPLDSCGTATDVSAGARTSWEMACVVQLTDPDGTVTFTIDFVDDYANNGVQVTSTTDASTVRINIYGDGGGGGTSSEVIEEDVDTVEEDDEEVIEEDADAVEEVDEEVIEEDDDQEEEEEEKEIIQDSPNKNKNTCDARYSCERGSDLDDFMTYQEHLSCAGIVTKKSNCTDANCTRNASRKEVAGIAMILGNHSPISKSKYTNHFTDINASSAEWVRSAVETGFGLGIFSSSRTFFRPDDNITRSESYAILMKSVCMPIPKVSTDWQLNVHAAAKAQGLTSRTFGAFGANDLILRQEIFVIGSHLLNYMNETGGCYEKVMCSE